MLPQMSLSLLLSQLDQSAICGRLAGLGMSQSLGFMLQVRVHSTHDSRTAPRRLAPGCGGIGVSRVAAAVVPVFFF
jgi:hypothetical protein